ncbi:MAG: branched-chain amino acid ABC transporter substrate-binding protein [Candidatus Methanomethylicota archaeon]|uniref:Branched-chain amino acid ABC transporter substrate-binding protein n=1 Tax=Thermoproteota archaeon TaxID=2056631 RepID=A0A497EUZ5_9CREN|nr:MAG: branched-chain amino acid ABC transporter substrate-binding protein [Candidatus Verstraetearchaeota archaeon]
MKSYKFYSRRGIAKIYAIVAVIIVILIVAGAAYYFFMMPKGPAVPEEIKVGLSISLTGKYARKGEYSLQAILAWQDWVNEELGGIYIKEYGKKLPVKIIYYDDKSEKETAVKLYEKLILEDKIHVALCPYSSALTYAVTPILDKYKIVSFSHGGASVKIYAGGRLKYSVQVLSPTTQYLAIALEMFATLTPKPTKVAIIFEDTEFPRSCAEAAKAKAEELGMTVVHYEGYPKGLKDFIPLLTKVKEKEPDILLGGGYLPDAVAIASQSKEINFCPKAFCLLVGVPMPDFYEALGKDAEYFYGPTQWEPQASFTPEVAAKMGLEFYGPTPDKFMELLAKSYKKYGIGKDIKSPEDVEYHHAEAFAACLVLQKALEEAGTLNSDKIRAVCNELHFCTFFGEFKIDPATGLQVGHKMVVIQWQNGKKEIVWPREVATADPVYPMPSWKERG